MPKYFQIQLNDFTNLYIIILYIFQSLVRRNTIVTFETKP